MKKDSFIHSILYMIASATSLSLVGLFGRIGFASFSLPTILLVRFLGSFLISSVLVFFFKQWEKPKFNLIRKNAIRAFFVLGSQYSFFYYIQKDSLMNATALLNTGPFFVPLIAWTIFREKIDRATWIGLSISFIGVLCIIQPESSLFSWSSLIGLFAGFCQGISQVLFGLHAKEKKSYLNIFYLFLFCSIGAFIPYAFWDLCCDLPKHFLWTNVLLFVFLGIASVCNQSFRAAAYKIDKPSRLSAFLYFSVLFSGVLDWVVFHKGPNLLSFLGAFLIVSGGTLKTALFLKSESKH